MNQTETVSDSQSLDRRLFEQMLRIRIIEKELASRYHEQEMRCPVHFCIGQEAPAVGVISALLSDDSVLSHHRSHGHYLARGGNLKKMVCELYGRACGCSLGKGGSMHLIDLSVNFFGSTSILSGTVPVAVGVGLAHKLSKTKNVSALFFGDGATEEGLFYESLNFAQLYKTPTLFVCENNFYSVYTGSAMRRPCGVNLKDIAASFGVHTVLVKENDVRLIHDATVEALDYIRSGGGPVFMEVHTYRYLEHCGPDEDDDLMYRPPEEVERWKANDPVSLMQNDLVNMGAISQGEMEKIKAGFLKETQEAINYARLSPYPSKEELLRDVFSH